MYPIYWSDFLRQNSLVGQEICIPEDVDLSGLGADLEIYDEADSYREATEFYPGIAVAADGFIPVAQCLIGSGDPYFINHHDGPNGPLYRIYHDAVAGGGYDRKKAVAIVLADFSQLLSFLEA